MTASNTSPPGRIAAIIPVGSLEGAKTRLGETLDAEERQDLTERLLAGTISAVLAVEPVADVLVVSPDRDVIRLAADLGARTLRQRSVGLNAGLAEARADVVAGGADAILVIPIDLAFVNAETLAGVLEPLLRGESAHRSSCSLPTATEPAPTPWRCGRRASSSSPSGRTAGAPTAGAAGAAGAAYVEVEGPLAVDIDTPADLILVESLAPERIGAG